MRRATKASLGALALELVEQWVLGDRRAGTGGCSSLPCTFRQSGHPPNRRARAGMGSKESGESAARLHGASPRWLIRIRRFFISLTSQGTARFDALRKQTGEMLREAAAARGLSLDALADRTVPDVGLDADGALRLPRSALAVSW